jgi:hypothetical protein
MARAIPVEVSIISPDSRVIEYVSETLRREHGAHGLRLVNTEEERKTNPDYEPKMSIVENPQDALLFTYRDTDGTEVHDQTTSNTTEINVALSKFALASFELPVTRQSSRVDAESIAQYMGDRPQIEADPSEWIATNPLIAELSRKYPQYGNLTRFLSNERGLFLKVGNYPIERAYWNSTTNGGLPIVKKADAIHEGTFMLHDMLHFVPIDPIHGSGETTNEDRSVYLTHRLLSEASTLVLADMYAVADADLKKKGYDTDKRRIFPVYESIVESNKGQAPELGKLLAANAHFCFTGDATAFRILGASESSIEEFSQKYESIFRDDFLWNLSNFNAMQDEVKSNPELREYYRWLEKHTAIPTLQGYTEKMYEEGGVNMAKMLSYFRADFNTALNYSRPIAEHERIRMSYIKYLTGQRIIFSRYANTSDAASYRDAFDLAFDSLTSAEPHDTETMRKHADIANRLVDQFVSRLEREKTLLPHEAAMNRLAVPLYPVKFVNYERSVVGTDSLSSQLKEFTELNSTHLHRLIEAVSA